jgi:hypothetical protein
MKLRKLLSAALPLFVMLAVRAAEGEGESEEVIALSPFSVTSEDDVGYMAASSLAGARLATNLIDPNGSNRLPDVPVTITKRAEALAVSFSLVNLGDKQDKRNSELYASIEALRAEIARKPGMRLEHREVRFASGNRSKLSIGRSGATSSHAAVLILADLPEGADVVRLVKTIRDTVRESILQGQTKIVDGMVGLYLKNPAKHRREILAKIFEDLDGLKKSLGNEFEILPSGFNHPVRARICSESDIELWIDYNFTIRSIREIEAAKK